MQVGVCVCVSVFVRGFRESVCMCSFILFIYLYSFKSNYNHFPVLFNILYISRYLFYNNYKVYILFEYVSYIGRVCVVLYTVHIHNILYDTVLQ